VERSVNQAVADFELTCKKNRRATFVLRSGRIEKLQKVSVSAEEGKNDRQEPTREKHIFQKVN
jgi:hypothetical protein